MTTAHRPTYVPARGGNNQGGNKFYIPTQQYSAKDLPGNLKMKFRMPGQGSHKDVKNRNFKKELLERENNTKIKGNNNNNSLNMLSSLYEGTGNFNII